MKPGSKQLSTSNRTMLPSSAHKAYSCDATVTSVEMFFDISAKGPECFRVLFQQPNLNLRVSAIMKTTRVFEFLDIEVRRVIHFKAALVIMGYNQDFLDYGKRLPVTSRTLGNIFM